jgi:hypothetical protein
MWVALRGAPIDQFLVRHPLLPKKHLAKKVIVAQVERAMRVASARCGGLDIDADHDAHKFQFCLMWVCFGKHRSPLAPSRAPWTEVVVDRVDRLYRGDFEALFAEASATAEVASRVSGQSDRVRRAVELAHLGKVSKAMGQLTSGGTLPLEEETVRDAFANMLQPFNLPPPEGWETYVTSVDGEAPRNGVYNFELGECEVIGPDGQVTCVDTLEHAMQQLDSTAAAGISGLGFDVLKQMSPSVVRPLLRVYFGQGRWDHNRPYHTELHALLVSTRGVALDKDGSGFEQGRPVSNLRPIAIGGAERRLAAQCQLLQLQSDLNTELVKNGQYGAGFKNGADTVYHMVAESLDAMVAAGVPGGVCQTDARNAFCSIHRKAIQRGLHRLAPRLLPAFDFLYGSNATGSCYFYGNGGPQPLGSCLVTDGTGQGEVFGGTFLAVAMDGMLTATRERMRNLSVDSTMLGQTIHVTGDTAGRLESGAPILVTADLPLTLVAAQTEVDATSDEGRGALRVMVRVGPATGPSSFLVEMPWEAVRHRAEIVVGAYYDDDNSPSPAYLLRPFTRSLKAEGD